MSYASLVGYEWTLHSFSTMLGGTPKADHRCGSRAALLPTACCRCKVEFYTTSIGALTTLKDKLLEEPNHVAGMPRALRVSTRLTVCIEHIQTFPPGGVDTRTVFPVRFWGV
eukprot:1139578-Pelagomonas_calceolata.AAC.1